MFEKLKIIKMFLSTLLLALLLISVFKSCSYAYSWMEFKDFSNQLRNESTTPGGIKTACNQLLNNISIIEPRIANAGINVNDYLYFVAEYGGDFPQNIDLYFFTNINSYSYNSRSCTLSGVNGKFCRVYNLRSGGYTIQNVQNISGNKIFNSSNNKNNLYGLIINSSNYGGYYFNNKYVIKWVMGIEHPNEPYDPLPLLIGQAMTSYSSDYNNVTFKLFNTEDISQEFNYEIDIQEGDKGYIYNIFLTSKGSVSSGNYYYLVMYENDVEIARSDNFLITFTDGPAKSGTITNTSGDVTGAIDLSGIETGLDNINNSINSGNLLIEEQTEVIKENQNFWQQAYNTIFIPSGDKIKNNIQKLKEHIGISGDVSGELLILENIKNNSGDFIIKWDTMQSHFSLNGVQLQKQLRIPSGEINFSKMERENETFQTTMNWVRVLLGFSLIVLIIKQTWTLILKTLGISTEVYEEHREEQERLNKAQARAEEKQKETIRRQLFNANQERLKNYNKLAKQKGWGKK